MILNNYGDWQSTLTSLAQTGSTLAGGAGSLISAIRGQPSTQPMNPSGYIQGPGYPPAPQGYSYPSQQQPVVIQAPSSGGDTSKLLLYGGGALLAIAVLGMVLKGKR